MVIILFRILILVAIILLVYTAVQYLNNPQRRLNIAKEAKEYYFLDEPNNSKKNFQFVYKGCLFEGEKYLGATEDSFEVVNINISVKEAMDLKGFTREDLYYLENEILLRYPHSKIKWNHPINELLLTNLD